MRHFYLEYAYTDRERGGGCGFAMGRDFRLTSATSGRIARSQKFSDVRLGDPLPIVSAKFWHESYVSLAGSGYSVLIGSNGTGKSRLLGAVAEDFMRIERAGNVAKATHSTLDHLAYQVDGLNVSIGVNAPVRGEVAVVPTPTKVISVALTPFDKFPLEVRSRRAYGRDESYAAEIDDDESFYHYVGMRDRTNRASVTALLYRAIEGLSRSRDRHEVARIRCVFEMLGYQPRVRVLLRAELTNALRDASLRQGTLFPQLVTETRLAQRLRSIIQSGRYIEDEIRLAIQQVSEMENPHGYIDIELDFLRDKPRTKINMAPIRLLRALGLIRLAAVQIWKPNGDQVDLRAASSGEISIFTAFLSISSFLEDGSLVLIDEPETGLHPEWQSRYVNLMNEVFGVFSGCHFILSTHSPFIISDLPKDAFVYSLDRGEEIGGSALSGRSPDFVMANAFDVIGPTNYYLRDVLTRALRLMSDGKSATRDFSNELTELHRLADIMHDGEQLKRVIADLERAQAATKPDAPSANHSN